MAIILASASPRRRELLALLLKDFVVQPADIDETPRPGELAQDYVLRLATEKAWAVLAHSTTEKNQRVIIAADTTVVHEGDVLGKPVGLTDARAMLRRLSGSCHQVHTGLAICHQSDVHRVCVSTDVEFVTLDEDLIELYLQTDEPWDKAGAYGIQGMAGSFVSGINGSYSSVVGLPLAQTRQLLRKVGINPQWTANSDD